MPRALIVTALALLALAGESQAQGHRPTGRSVCVTQAPSARAHAPRPRATGRSAGPRTAPRAFRSSRRPARTRPSGVRTVYPSGLRSPRHGVARRAPAVRPATQLAAEGLRVTYDGREQRAARAATQPAPSPQRPLAPRLLAALSEGKLELACRLAAWAEGSSRRQRVLREALFLQFPSPTLLQGAARLLRRPHWQSVTGRDTLLRILDEARPHSGD